MAGDGMTPNVVTITVDDARVQPWNAEIGDPHDRPLPSVLLFMAGDIHLALHQGNVVWPNRSILSVSQSGFATVTTPDGHAYLYELFPAKFSDDCPYQPLCYVGRWPD